LTLVVDRNVLYYVLAEAVDGLLTEGANQGLIGQTTGLYAGHLLLLWNLKEAWQQGSPSEEDSQAAQKVADTIAASFVRAVKQLGA
jgi:hypothetical protein